ncbi:hypothetical protein C7T35_27540 [Variovorax sp. WS11]|nr:hypothetical protein C7T35_27540 [Variovorax sp. WS11]
MHGAEAWAVSYSLMVVIDDESGEDGAPCPFCESVPVWLAAGGRHPRLSELAGLSIVGIEGWDAWLGNDAPPLVNNRLLLQGWQAPGLLRMTWNAEYEHREMHGVPRVGYMEYSGTVEFEGIRLNVDSPSDADHVIASFWGEQQLQQLEREDGDWLVLRELQPALQSKMPDALGRWLAGFPPLATLRRKLLPVSYRPKALP